MPNIASNRCTSGSINLLIAIKIEGVPRQEVSLMKSGHSPALSIVGKLPGGYVILCRTGDDEYSFLAKTLGISVECPHCGATRHSVELAQEYFLGKDRATRSSIGMMTRSYHMAPGPKPGDGVVT
jgi:hypothetical protein